MPQASHTTTMSTAGQSIGRGRTRSADADLAYTVDLPAGDGGELTTRTNDTVGTATMDEADHGMVTGIKVDIFWNVGGVAGLRYGVTVGTVAGLSVPFSGGSGDNLPVATSGLTLTRQVSASANIDGDQVQLLGIEHQQDTDTDTAQGHVQFMDSGAAEIHQLTLERNKAQIFDIGGGDSNPFTGNPITELLAANGSPTNAAKLVVLSLENITTTTTTTAAP